MASAENISFLNFGVQYYVAARSGAIAQIMPVCGNLYHHAIEMFLKARLSQKYSLGELKKRFMHKLPPLWQGFKNEFPDHDLTEFDKTIETLDKLEQIRYLDEIIKQGAEIRLNWEPGNYSSTYGEGQVPPPKYEVVVTDIDRLVAKIFEICSRNPAFFTNSLNGYAKNAITRDNPAARALIK